VLITFFRENLCKSSILPPPGSASPILTNPFYRIMLFLANGYNEYRDISLLNITIKQAAWLPRQSSKSALRLGDCRTSCGSPFHPPPESSPEPDHIPPLFFDKRTTRICKVLSNQSAVPLSIRSRVAVNP
jgi:hypothetical protein